MANNDKTQAILDQLGDYSDVQATLNKLNNSLAKVEVRDMDVLHLKSSLVKREDSLENKLNGQIQM